MTDPETVVRLIHVFSCCRPNISEGDEGEKEDLSAYLWLISP